MQYDDVDIHILFDQLSLLKPSALSFMAQACLQTTTENKLATLHHRL